MSIFILKFILCSVVLYAVYYFILRKEKTFHFNRFYLLSILGLSLLFPTLITKTKVVEVQPIQLESMILSEATINDVIIDSNPIQNESGIKITQSEILWTAFGLISFFFLIRFSHNLYQIYRLRKGGKIVKEDGLTFCLRSDINASFTFLNTIYTNKERFEQGLLPKEIISHESVHAHQKHSLDIIAMELMQCVLWFNPLLYMIKASVKMNHEYLADQKVCESTSEISQYQKTLIQYVYNSKQQPVMASQLTYGQTKNRLNMMVKNLQIRSAVVRVALTLLVTAGALWGFGETQIVAQSPNSTQDLQSIVQKNDQDVVFNHFKVKYLDEDGKWQEADYAQLSELDKVRFKQEEAKGQFYVEATPANKPTEKQMREFLDPKEYGVWIDGQRMENKVISNYKASDFHHFYVSKLKSNAKNFGKHTYQLDLTTQKEFEKQPFGEGGWKYFLEYLQDQEKAKKKQDLPPPPPPRLVQINDKTWVKFEYANGDVVEGEFGKMSERSKEIFMSPQGKGQILLPPPPPAMIRQELLNEFADSKFKVWIDGEVIKSTNLTNYKPEEFYLYNKQLSVSKDGKGRQITGIQFITRKEWKNSGRDEGKWIDFRKEFLPQEEKSSPPPPERNQGNKGGSISGTNMEAFNITVTNIQGNTISLNCEGCAWKTLSFGSTFNNDHTVDFYGVTSTSKYRLKDSPFAFSIAKGREIVSLVSLKGTTWSKINVELASFEKGVITHKGIKTQKSNEHYGLLKNETLLRFKNKAGSKVEKRYATMSSTEKEGLFSDESEAEIFMVFGKTEPMNNQEWEALQDTQKYGIWLNGDQIKNTDLLKISPQDIYKYSLRTMHPSMSNLGDFEIWYFAHTKEWVSKNNTLIGDDYGTWLSFKQTLSLHKGVAEGVSPRKN